MQTLVDTQGEAESSRFLSWDVPDWRISIRLSRDVANALNTPGRRWFRRAGETGGILFGSVERDGGRTVLQIEESLEIPCEHLFGPSYSLSGGDKEGLREVLEHCRKDGRLRPLGFYRTHTRPGLGLDADDLQLFPEFFPGELALALLAKRRAFGRRRAAFFIAGVQALEVALPRKKGRPRGPFWCSWWVQGPLLACLVAADGLLGYVCAGQIDRIKQAPPEMRDPYALSLMVLEYGDNLHLTWDRHSRPVAEGKSARLYITDGGEDRSMDLTAEQLRNGSVIYRKVSGQVRFRLEVFIKERRSVSETWERAVSAGEAPPEPVSP